MIRQRDAFHDSYPGLGPRLGYISRNAPLVEAASRGDIGAVRAALAESEGDEDFRENLNEAFLAAATYGRTDACAYLLDCGAKRQARGGEQALMLAALGGREATVALLLERGADPNAMRGLALWIAAACGGEAEIVRLLLRAGADPNARGGDILCRAIQAEHFEATRALLEGGADCASSKGIALELAIRGGNPAIIKLLLVEGGVPFSALRAVCRRFGRQSEPKASWLRFWKRSDPLG